MAMKKAIRVLMADDHMIFRQGVRKLLEGEDDISIVGEAANGNECGAMMAKLKPDLLLLDINMPDKDGLAVLQELNFDSLPTQVIVLTASEMTETPCRRCVVVLAASF
jgi:two-component system response regulator DegU